MIHKYNTRTVIDQEFRHKQTHTHTIEMKTEHQETRKRERKMCIRKDEVYTK